MEEAGSKLQVSVVIPCYNELESIQATLEQLADALQETSAYELIVVDDASDDGTWPRLQEIAASGKVTGLRLLRHQTNLGYGAAVKTGVRRAHAELIVIIDADGTYPCERIPELLAEADNAEMVVGARIGEGVSYSRLRKIPKLFLRSYCSWLVGRTIPDMNSGLRVFRRSVFKRYMNVLPDGFSLTTTLTVAMMRGGYEVIFIPISYAERIGRSKIRPIRDTIGFAQLILRTGMYFAPLRVLAPLIAFLSFLFVTSLVYDVLVLENLTDKSVLLLLFTMNTSLFALLADMIDKRSH